MALSGLALILLVACGRAGGPATSQTPTPTVALTHTPMPTFAPTPTAALTRTPMPTLSPTPAVALTRTPFPTVAPMPVEFVWKLGPEVVQEPAGPYVDEQGNLYVLDVAQAHVVKFDADGQVLLTFGEPGSGDGQFNFRPVRTPLYHDLVYGGDLAVDQDGNIYVADGSNFRVQVFDAQGNYLRQWGQRGTAAGDFEVPWTIALDALGVIYVGDFTGYISKFDSNGEFLGRLGGGQGSGPGQFQAAVHDVEADAHGNVYASDFKLARIFKFDPAGQLVLEWNRCGGPLGPAGLGVDSNGHVYVIDQRTFRICIFDAQGNVLSAFGEYGEGEGEFQFGQGADVTIDLNGNIYVTSDDPPWIQKFQLPSQ